MMTRFSRRDRRVLGFGILVVLTILAGGRGLPLWKAWMTESRDRAWQANTQLERLRAVARNKVATAESLASANQAYLALAPQLLDGDGAATMGASLLALVSSAAGRSGLEVGSIQSIQDSAGIHFIRVAVRGEASGDVLGLAAFLEALETSPSSLGLRELSVEQPEPAAPHDRPEALRIQFLVEGVGLRKVGRQ
jgi:hypothetical protein